MRIIDALWTPTVNHLIVRCPCGLVFEQRADRRQVRCQCGRHDNIEALRLRWVSQPGGRMSFNKVILLGRLGADPESRFTATGTQVVNMRIATSEHYNGEEKTEWHRIVVFGKVAETCAKYLSKGREVLIEGRIQTNQWEDQSGQKRYTTEIVANQVRFVGSNGGQKTQQASSQPASSSASFTDDDIPF